MPRPANSLVIAVDGTAWPVQTEPQVPDLEDIYPLIGAPRAEVLPIRPNLDHSAGQRVSADLDGLDLDFWFGRMSAYEQPQNFVATVLSQALGGTSSVLHGPIVLQAGSRQTGDSLPLSIQALTTLQEEVRTITSIPDVINGIATSIANFHHDRARDDD